MKKTFVDVMLELPVDATLRDFLTTHSLPVPDGFTWDDTPETSQFLVEARFFGIGCGRRRCSSVGRACAL